MITETMSDPRRANWLTISMAEDISWPEENGTNRPNWELEAEILRLTTRLMMRERELSQVKDQLKTQAHWAEQKTTNWKKKMLQKEEQMQLLLLQKDSEMQTIVSQLVLFEAGLKQEQNKIERLLKEKDATIKKQKEEIERLKCTVTKLEQKEGIVIRAQNPVLKSASLTRDIVNDTSSILNVANRINDEGGKNSYKYTSISTFPKERKNTLGQSETKVPYLSTNGHSHQDYPKERSHSSISRTSSFNTNSESDPSIRKIRDGLLRIRAIQDLTNVRSRSDRTLISEVKGENHIGIGEKRRIPHKTPQKMKDLKAKRINGQHRSHRSELYGQVIL